MKLKLNAASNEYIVLNNDLKWSIVLAFFTLCGNRFHRAGPATLKDPSPYDLSLEYKPQLWLNIDT